ncbi:MAG: DNA polymerase I, partial [Candidatus Omnitrophica bacterium]|nr:DNA polymerase I [Candidatus Omnitrophota bacterium]
VVKVGDRIKVYRLEGDKVTVMDAKGVEERWGVDPAHLTDVMALTGDATDDIQGVPGIGPKRAVELVKAHGSLDQMIRDIDSIEPPERRKLLQENRQRIALNQMLVTIRTDAPVEFDAEKLLRRPPDAEQLYRLFRLWEFKRLARDLAPKAQPPALSYERVEDASAAGKFAAAVRTVQTITLHPVWQEAGVLCGCAIAAGEKLVYLDFCSKEVMAAAAALFADPAIEKIGYDLKSLRLGLLKRDVELRGDSLDVMVAAYLIDPSKGDYPLSEIAQEYLGAGEPFSNSADSAVCAARTVHSLAPVLTEQLRQRGLETLYREIEHPLIEVLARIEFSGMALDVDLLSVLRRQLDEELDRITGEINASAGKPFNINSPKQLSEILFQHLKLPVVKRTKTGCSTDEEVLQRLSAQHPLPQAILRYRELAKLKSTYVDALPQMVDARTRRLHASFNQTVTATGRLSSSNPNLQNIPVRTEQGRQIRRAFVSRWKGGCILAADYSQIELRILAHLSQDEILQEAFKGGQDIHRVTAAIVLGIPEGEVSGDQRAAAKTVNFGILYGMSAFGLSKALGMEVAHAEQFIREYFQRYPKVKIYLDRSLQEARDLGYCLTLFQRRRYIPQLKSDNVAVRQFAERTAINAPIQGSAADLIKAAMIRIHRELKTQNLRSIMVLQVHDELVFDVYPGELERVRSLVSDCMVHAMDLDVPIQVHLNSGPNWLEAAHG